MSPIGFTARCLPLVLAAGALLGSATAGAYQVPDQNPTKQPKENFGDRQAGKFGSPETEAGKFGTEGADGQFRSSKVAPVRRADAVPVLDARPVNAATVAPTTGAVAARATVTTTTTSSRTKR